MEKTSLVNPIRLESLARAVGCGDWERLKTVCNDLKEGADIGCVGKFREPSVSGNRKVCRADKGYNSLGRAGGKTGSQDKRRSAGKREKRMYGGQGVWPIMFTFSLSRISQLSLYR